MVELQGEVWREEKRKEEEEEEEEEWRHGDDVSVLCESCGFRLKCCIYREKKRRKEGEKKTRFEMGNSDLSVYLTLCYDPTQLNLG